MRCGKYPARGSKRRGVKPGGGSSMKDWRSRTVIACGSGVTSPTNLPLGSAVRGEGEDGLDLGVLREALGVVERDGGARGVDLVGALLRRW